MSAQSIDSHRFNLRTKTFESQSTALALEKAKQIVNEATKDIRASITSQVLCTEAYNMFKQKLEGEFNSDSYEALVKLTLQSREDLFFVKLKDDIKAILLSRPTVESS